MLMNINSGEKMKRFLGFAVFTFFTSSTLAVELSNTDYGFPLGENKYFQEHYSGNFVLSDNGAIKKLNITAENSIRVFKLQNEYVVLQIAMYHYPVLTVNSISKDFKSKAVEFDVSNIPDYMINGDFHCKPFEKSNTLYFNCSNESISKNIYKYIYSNGGISPLNKVDNSQARVKNCSNEYQYYKYLRDTKPKNGYNSKTMPLSITRGLNSRLKNVDEVKFAQILNNPKLLTLQQFTVKYCP